MLTNMIGIMGVRLTNISAIHKFALQKKFDSIPYCSRRTLYCLNPIVCQDIYGSAPYPTGD